MQIPTVNEIIKVCNRKGIDAWGQARAVRAFLEQARKDEVSPDDLFDAANDVEKVLTWMNREDMLV